MDGPGTFNTKTQRWNAVRPRTTTTTTTAKSNYNFWPKSFWHSPFDPRHSTAPTHYYPCTFLLVFLGLFSRGIISPQTGHRLVFEAPFGRSVRTGPFSLVTWYPSYPRSTYTIATIFPPLCVLDFIERIGWLDGWMAGWLWPSLSAQKLRNNHRHKS